MKRKMLYLGLLVTLTIFALIGAILTPVTVSAQNPYVVGGTVEAPVPTDVGLVVGLLAAVAIALGALVAKTMLK